MAVTMSKRSTDSRWTSRAWRRISRPRTGELTMPAKLTFRLKEVQEGLNDAEREADEAKRDSTLARSQFLELKKKR